MNYNELTKETKLFINKAIDIYSIIHDKKIIKNVPHPTMMRLKCSIMQEYEFTKLDKKVLSLFIAGFLIDGNLKQMFSQYDDIKLDQLFDFIDTKEKDITPIPENRYEELFERNFKLDLISIIKHSYFRTRINFITPEVIILSLQFIKFNGSNILNHFAGKYNLKNCRYVFSDHPLFDALETYTTMDGSISREDLPKENNIRSSSPFILSTNRKNVVIPNEQLNKKQLSSINFDDESIWTLLDDIQKNLLDKKLLQKNYFIILSIINN